MTKKIYISGKISDLPYNVAYNKFRDAEIALNERQGIEAVNPMMLDVNVHPSNDAPDWCDYMLTDLDILMRQCHGVYMLRDWRDSKGARIEHAIAEVMEKEIFYEGSL